MKVKKLYIALDGGRKLNVGSLRSFHKKEFKLRTVDANQYQAMISVGLSGDGQDELLHSSLLQNLKAASNGYSYLACQLKREGNQFSIIIKNETNVVCRESFNLIPPKVQRRNILIGLGTAIILLLLFLFFLLFDFSSFSTSSFQNTTESLSQKDVGSVEKLDKSIPTEIIAPEKQLAPVTKDDTVPEKVKPIEPATSVIEKVPQLSLKERSIYFPPNSTLLEKEAESTLEKILTVLLENPDLRVNITGHCAIAGTEAGRQEISVQRAENTLAWLKQNGWNPSLSPKVTGEAGNFPLTMNLDEQEINRRVEIEYSN